MEISIAVPQENKRQRIFVTKYSNRLLSYLDILWWVITLQCIPISNHVVYSKLIYVSYTPIGKQATPCPLAHFYL